MTPSKAQEIHKSPSFFRSYKYIIKSNVHLFYYYNINILIRSRLIVGRLVQHEQLVSSLEFGSGTEWIEQLISIHQKNREDAQDPFKKRL